MDLSEIFFSIQGESAFSGLPCLFIRLAGCNLRCSYCDTTYSYQATQKKSITEIIDTIKSLSDCKLVEITGGEPLIQKETIVLIHELHQYGYQILLETNGSISLDDISDYAHKIVDVKCPGSGESTSFLLSNLERINPATDELKFVLCDRHDFDWSLSQLDKWNWNAANVVFSPVYGLLSPQLLAEWILEQNRPIRLQLQLHKYIWHPSTRGV
ncbi:MAG: radical SAM protein [Candidatus Cloacimonetes bacterium]|nr:radical SAM protein [Candidatus Cloacimonadota bacterium]